MDKPLVSIGIPVYNGADFLAEAVDSLLNQTYKNIEILISDNASDDSTQEISEKYAAIDQRVKYFRHETNKGAAFNYNFVFEKAKGKYFKWAAHDDVCHRAMIEKCIYPLESDESVALCATKTQIIDSEGRNLSVADLGTELSATGTSPSKRFKEYLTSYHRDGETNQIFGVFRHSILAKTKLIGNYPSSDLLLLSQVAMLGKIVLHNERYFYRRDHGMTSLRANRNKQEVANWFDTKINKQSNVYPFFRRLGDYLQIIAALPTSSGEKLHCYFLLFRWFFKNVRNFSKETLSFFYHKRIKTV